MPAQNANAASPCSAVADACKCPQPGSSVFTRESRRRSGALRHRDFTKHTINLLPRLRATYSHLDVLSCRGGRAVNFASRCCFFCELRCVSFLAISRQMFPLMVLSDLTCISVSSSELSRSCFFSRMCFEKCAAAVGLLGLVIMLLRSLSLWWSWCVGVLGLLFFYKNGIRALVGVHKKYECMLFARRWEEDASR